MMKMKNRSHRHDINSPRPRYIVNIINIRSALLWWCLYVLSNIWAIFKGQLMWKLRNTEAELKKSVPYKEACIWSLKLLLHESWKNQFCSSRFHRSWNCDLRADLFNGFLQKSSPFLQRSTCVRFSKENLFCSNKTPF